MVESWIWQKDSHNGIQYWTYFGFLKALTNLGRPRPLYGSSHGQAHLSPNRTGLNRDLRLPPARSQRGICRETLQAIAGLRPHLPPILDPTTFFSQNFNLIVNFSRGFFNVMIFHQSENPLL